MRILLISPVCPLPLEKGGAIRIWNIAKKLSKHHRVDLVCFIRTDEEMQYESELKQVFGKVTFIKRRKIVSPSSLLTRSFFSFFTMNFGLIIDVLHPRRPDSFLFVLYNHVAMKKFLLNADRQRKYDLFYAETFYAIASLRDSLKKITTPLLLIEQNIEWMAYKRQAERMKVFFLKWYALIDSFNMSVEEGFFWNHVKYLGGLSTVDVEVMSKESGRKDILLVENGVDLAWFGEKVSKRVDNEVLFVGSFSYFQNVDSLRWLLDEVWPKVMAATQQRGLDLQLRIVGRGAEQSLKQYVRERGFIIDESVNDIREAFQHATVLIAPIRAGSGTKYKVLEAMASRLGVITTTVGAEGLAISSGEEAIIANSAQEIADAVLTAVQSTSALKLLGEKGYTFVEQSYDWNRIVEKLEKDMGLK